MFECFFDGLRMSGGYLLYSSPNLKNTYIKEIPLEQQKPFIDLSDKMLSLNTDLQKNVYDFLEIVKLNFSLKKVSQKLAVFYTLKFGDFLKELKQEETPPIQLKWLKLFEEQQKQLLEIENEINKTDNEINNLVYSLYNLSDEEIKIIEESD